MRNDETKPLGVNRGMAARRNRKFTVRSRGCLVLGLLSPSSILRSQPHTKKVKTKEITS